MATYTSNINLKKPAQSDKIRIADFNGNADNIDAAIGADFGQGTKPSINQAINSLADGLAIIANGNVHAAVTAGQFVYVRGHDTLSEGLYVATSNISANGTLSGSNLTADGSGGLNALNSKILPSALTITLKTGFSLASWGWIRAVKVGHICIITFSGLKSDSAISSETNMATIDGISANGMHFSIIGGNNTTGLIRNDGSTIVVNNMVANTNYFGELIMAIN